MCHGADGLGEGRKEVGVEVTPDLGNKRHVVQEFKVSEPGFRVEERSLWTLSPLSSSSNFGMKLRAHVTVTSRRASNYLCNFLGFLMMMIV